MKRPQALVTIIWSTTSRPPLTVRVPLRTSIPALPKTLVMYVSPPVTLTMPVEVHAVEPMIIEDTIEFVPPLTFKVPLEPAFCATRTVLACQVPLEVVIRPTPLSPTNVPLGFTNSPPVNHTVPVQILE